MFRRYTLFIFFYGFVFSPVTIHAQKNTDNNGKEYTQIRLFNDNDSLLHFKLVGKLNSLFNDRSNNNSYHPVLIQYLDKDSNTVSINLMAKTRGHFRRIKANCKMPPLLLDFPKEEKNKNSIFERQRKLKLVVPCQGDEYVIREWLVYKLYNLVTQKSFRAKLVLVDFEDSLKQRKPETHYCILLEDEKKVAGRNDAFVWRPKMLAMQNTNKEDFKKLAVFEYMIGNTDWSVPYLQNIILITKDSTAKAKPFAIPYDFDHAGIVDAPYAGPAPELEISSVRVRLYRGFCENDMKVFTQTFELFNQLKNNIYNLYKNCSLLNPKYIKFVTRYLDDFYKTINNDRIIETEFGKPCRDDIRVEIKGLKN
jgi:hypothetical protein